MNRLILLSACALAVPGLALARPSAMHPVLSAKLAGSAEVPKVATAAHGIVNLDLKASTGKVCWTFQIVGLRGATQAHIHKGRARVAGNVVVPLGANYAAKGCTAASKKTIEAIESDPNGYYVNVHTKAHPNGAIRGQLVAGMAHM